MNQNRTERERLKRDLDRLCRKYQDCMAGRMVPNARAQAIRREIDKVEAEIRRLDRDAVERLALEKAPIDEVLEVIAIPLLADVLNDVVAGVDGMLRRNGCQSTVFGIYTSQIRKATLAMVDTLDNTSAGLPKLLDVDDALIDAIKKKLMSFIKQRLNITK